MNPRYAAYARANGLTPEAQLAADRAAWPGGAMAGYILWMHARWAEWRQAHGPGPNEPISETGHVAFDAWLTGPVA
jgi:hypothetical protein